ncbi:hypothetical protein [Marinobacter sp.]|uniref:phage late control D family protein n=1 Tax=Marinobacter sp. TaxID=50741 RepID=UPI002B47FBF3|nr:hypothetical protein [Marinobacter sp.]HKK56809.1 hypothetical protein [Marinobacter sp.]
MVSDLFDWPQRAPAECKMFLDGEEIADYYPLLREVLVDTSRTDAWTASLRFAVRRDELGRWDILDDGKVRDWAAIRLEVHFGDGGASGSTLFKGYIREVNIEMPEDAGAAEVVVECQDQSLRLDRAHRAESWGEESPTSDFQIITDILGNYDELSLHPDSQPGQSGLEQLGQEASDIEFLQKRAEANHYELIFYPDQVYFGPPRLEAATSQPTIMVYAGQGTNCLRMNVNTDGHLPDAITYNKPTGENQEEPEVSAPVFSSLEALGPERADSRDTPLEDHEESLSGQGGNAEDELEAKAQARINDMDLHRVQAEGELDGSLYGQLLRPGKTVPVDGMGERFSGVYYVDRVSHRITPEGYRQEFTLLRNAYGDNTKEAQAFPSILAAVFEQALP